MGKINDKPLPLYQVISNLPKDVPFEIIDNLVSWDMIIKSPYGYSYYNAPVDWNVKPHGSLRIADHWNFYSKNKMHCETSVPVETNTHWTIGKFDETIKKYVPIASYPKSKTSVKKTLEYKLLWFEIRRLRAIDCLISNVGHDRNAPLLAHLELDKAEQFIEILEDFLK